MRIHRVGLAHADRHQPGQQQHRANHDRPVSVLQRLKIHFVGEQLDSADRKWRARRERVEKRQIIYCFILISDFIKSSFALEHLNLSFNALKEFDGAILSQNKRLTELDVSHNQITTLKLNEVTHEIALATESGSLCAFRRF